MRLDNFYKNILSLHSMTLSSNKVELIRWINARTNFRNCLLGDGYLFEDNKRVTPETELHYLALALPYVCIHAAFWIQIWEKNTILSNYLKQNHRLLPTFIAAVNTGTLQIAKIVWPHLIENNTQRSDNATTSYFIAIINLYSLIKSNQMDLSIKKPALNYIHQIAEDFLATQSLAEKTSIFDAILMGLNQLKNIQSPCYSTFVNASYSLILKFQTHHPLFSKTFLKDSNVISALLEHAQKFDNAEINHYLNWHISFASAIKDYAISSNIGQHKFSLINQLVQLFNQGNIHHQLFVFLYLEQNYFSLTNTFKHALENLQNNPYIFKNFELRILILFCRILRSAAGIEFAIEIRNSFYLAQAFIENRPLTINDKINVMDKLLSYPKHEEAEKELLYFFKNNLDLVSYLVNLNTEKTLQNYYIAALREGSDKFKLDFSQILSDNASPEVESFLAKFIAELVAPIPEFTSSLSVHFS